METYAFPTKWLSIERCKIIFGFEWWYKPSLHTRSKVVKARCFQKVQFPWFGPISFSDIINFVRKVSLWRRRRNWSKQRELKLLEASRWTRFPRKISPWRPKSPRPKNQHIIFYFVLLEKKGNSWIWHEELYFF